MSWKILGRCVEGEPFTIAGVNVWDHAWKSLGPEPVPVFDPTYRETYTMRRYEIAPANARIGFAAGETSASVWMFCVEES